MAEITVYITIVLFLLHITSLVIMEIKNNINSIHIIDENNSSFTIIDRKIDR